MSVNRLRIFQKILVTQLNHWTCFSVWFIYFIVNYARSENTSLQIGAWLLFGVIPAELYLTEVYINKALLFWGTHIGVVVAMVLLPMGSFSHKLIYLGMTFIYSILSVLSRYGKERFSKRYLPIPAYFGIAVVLLLVLQYLELHEYQRYYLYLLIFQVFLCCITMYVERYLEYISVHKHSIGYMPVQNAFVAGMKLIGSFTLVVSLVLLAVAGVGEMNDILNYLKKPFRAIMNKLMEFLQYIYMKLQGKEQTIKDDTPIDMTLLTDVTQEPETSVLADILMLVLFIVVLIFVAKCLWKLMLAWVSRLRVLQNVSEEEEISQDIQEETRSIDKEKKRRFDLFAGETPAEKIRKRFKKKIEGSQALISAKGKREQMELYTARESADILAMPKLGDLYEKARYSPYECTTEDVKQMKQLCKSKN